MNVTSVTARFYDAAPNPITAFVPFTNGSGNPDTIATMETEGYWTLRPNKSPTGGSYDVKVAPDRRFWTFTAGLGSGRYALLKQSAVGTPWDFVISGLRIDDSTTNSFANFSNYALGYADSIIPPPLPVELLEFSAICRDRLVELSWISASETNAENYILERSSEGKSFVKVAEVPSHGNSSVLQIYRYTDEHKGESYVSYYRLLQRDLDGEVSDLATIHVDCNTGGEVASVGFYPNPACNKLYTLIHSPAEGSAALKVYDLYGKIVYESSGLSLQEGTNLQSWDFPASLSPGFYTVNVRFANYDFSERLIIIR
jgi:hypothetical protein